MDSNFENATKDDFVRIRGWVVENPAVAFVKWPSVIDDIIHEVDQFMLKRLVNDSEQLGEGVYRTLNHWHSYGKKRKNLLVALRKNGLGAVADKIEENMPWLLVGQEPPPQTPSSSHAQNREPSQRGHVIQAAVKSSMDMDWMGLEVRIEPTDSAKGSDDPLNYYKMTSNPRGFALLINNWKFPSPTGVDRDRPSSLHDYATMNRVLRHLNYHVMPYQNVTSADLDGILGDFQNAFKDLQVDSCVVCIMSHGAEGVVEMADGVPINYWEIIYQFDSKFWQFKDKPKIFIIQACATFEQQIPAQPPLSTDISNALVCHSTLPGTYDFQHQYKGSPYILCLANVIMRHACDTEARKLFEEKMQESMREIKWGGEHPNLQTPHIRAINFHKQFYFNPGI